ncbi:carbohydrate ABC transporter ATP-binding protein, CUT1 family [Tistlia consotensis]|uniref:Carbohydrate ABC transporter ATP-binding protein, CUT1 family n=1 Tax=Tistlia consotensis USBA 355 TaxID=560819 RepID=A0A1Y6BMC1_9PROT|nr:ABC transporter ATP-binding protein [Tistlia consotensis]SMF18717.1 carbohydrate ABC transporter ATP-binding protein, CUT1 family [Tistlia consotensis USBA 355]SNR39448.1 carbohydrate ABC transporter ATP-binding protein, CUT1 family [Tistlia consotensis]
MARITLEGLAHSYLPAPRGPEDFALKQLDHVWEDGGAYALLGPSGCGKTTLLNIISGLIRPTRGEIRFDGQDVTDLPPEQRNIAQVFQFPVIYDTMTVYENLAFPLCNRRMAPRAVDARVREIAEMLDLGSELRRKARNLTADAKQKISLGRGLVRADVAAILFDEPLTVIDPHLKWLLRSQLKHLHRRFDFTMIYVTHDQTEALTFADKVVVMYEGEVVQVGTPDELFERPAHTFVGYFIGSPGMNILPAEISGDRARIEGHELPLGAAYGRLPAGARVEIGIRPEFLSLARAGEAAGAAVPATIRAVEDVGRYRIARTRIGEHEVAVVAPEDGEIPSDGACVVFDPQRINVYADGHRVQEGG